MRAGHKRSQDAVSGAFARGVPGENPTAHMPSPTGGQAPPRPAGYAHGMDADTRTIIGTVLAVGFGLAALILRSTARQDRRMDRFEDAMSAHRTRFEDAMDTFRAEMQRLAERQSHAEGRVDERGSSAD